MNYASMSDLELVGHVSGIPDASEISKTLANRVKLLSFENQKLEKKVAEMQRQILSLELGIALDKISAYEDLVK